MPTPPAPGERRYFWGRVNAHTAWRGLIVLLLLAVGLIYFLLPTIYRQNRETAAEGVELSCRLGSFFIGQPIERERGQSQADYRTILHRAEGFLRSLVDADCSGVKGAQISREQIERQIRRIHHARERVRGGDARSGSPPGNSPPGGGSSGQDSPPPDRPPPGSTTTTTTPPPTTTPAPRPGPVERICHLTRLGERVCQIVPIG